MTTFNFRSAITPEAAEAANAERAANTARIRAAYDQTPEAIAAYKRSEDRAAERRAPVEEVKTA